MDAGYAAGNTVTPYYDPLLAKLCVYGADREEALERARAAVDGFTVEGLKTNLPFFAELLDAPGVRLRRLRHRPHRADARVSDLRVEHRDGALWLTIDREERRNALSSDVLAGMLAALRDPGDARVIVVAGAGDRVFCSGADLTVMAPESTGLEEHEARGLLRDVVLAMRACPVPVVARVQGLCLAGGVGLALGCDLVVASAQARFGLPEVDLGLWPFMVSALLARHVSPKHALDLMLLAERVDADTAYAMGLVSRVLPAEELDAGFAELVRRLAAKAPVAVRLGKAAFHAVEEMTLAPGLEAMQAQLSLITTTHDVKEGVAAFFDKREARWSGR